ncbi:T9SS type A sorting domain-containing protein [Hymenobacter negativus]|uniref:T9SS type A sorting domain-containing protein n=1 Tax=Hymenobacter negativus TaxID=2795026 RepID=A0ABS0Q9L9_9BACT|nr:hypothetical protein [Hymenobacter negativus]MBH8559320.1 hypothetical protein [Hymenobacter negativus]
MKQFSSLLVMLAAGLCATTARAQAYRPFRFGLSYQLSATTPGDTTHVLRLVSRQAQGSDSLFMFDKRTSRGRGLPQQGNCGYYVQRNDNLFGTSLTQRPGAEYVLTAANGRTFTLRPRTALNQAWAATTAGLTARVTARTLGTVLGQPDSLATITLSDGAVITLGKRLGWVSGPALGHYLNARLPQATLTLTALPELGLGTNQLGAFAVYDFQPGDVFLRKNVNQYALGPGAICQTQIWTRDSIISRTLSTSGDALDYQLQRRTLTRNCSGAPVLSAPVVQTLHITRTTDHLDRPTGFWEGTPSAGTGGLVHLPAWRTADYNGRLVQHHAHYMQCGTPTADSTSLLNGSNLDAGYSVRTAAGLGQTQEEYTSFTIETTTLLGYRKGTEIWGQLTTFAQLLPVRASRPASTTVAFPNPFGAEIQVAFALASPQSVGLTLHDALGRQVREIAVAPQPAGARQLTLPTAGLPVGVYSLHLRFAGEGRTEVLRVVKAE